MCDGPQSFPVVPSSLSRLHFHSLLRVILLSKLVELASEMRRHSATSVSDLKRKYNHLVPSNERVLGLAESEKNMSLVEVRLRNCRPRKEAPSPRSVNVLCIRHCIVSTPRSPEVSSPV